MNYYKKYDQKCVQRCKTRLKNLSYVYEETIVLLSKYLFTQIYLFVSKMSLYTCMYICEYLVTMNQYVHSFKFVY